MTPRTCSGFLAKANTRSRACIKSFYYGILYGIGLVVVFGYIFLSWLSDEHLFSFLFLVLALFIGDMYFNLHLLLVMPESITPIGIILLSVTMLTIGVYCDENL